MYALIFLAGGNATTIAISMHGISMHVNRNVCNSRSLDYGAAFNIDSMRSGKKSGQFDRTDFVVTHVIGM